MKVIVVSSLKGGTGKSTLTLNLAVAELALKHSKVAILDLDPQGSCVFWQSNRPHPEPLVKAVEPDNLLLVLSELEEDGYDWVLVDMPPFQKKWVRKAMNYADLVLIPTRASPFDLHSNQTTLGWARELGQKVSWVINSASPHSKTANVVLQTLSAEAPVCRTVVHDRNDMVLSLGLGLGVMEYAPNSKASAEVRALHQEVRSLLKLKPSHSKA